MEIRLDADEHARLAEAAAKQNLSPEQLARNILLGGLVVDTAERSKFADFEQYYLLQYIYYGDLRIAALVVGITSGLSIYFTQFASKASGIIHTFLAISGFSLGILALGLILIAICPLPPEFPLILRLRRMFTFFSLGRRVPDRARFTHYLEFPKFDGPRDYLGQFNQLNEGAIVQEKLRHCYELGVIVKERMDYVIGGTIASGLTLLVLLGDIFAKSMGWYG